MSAGKNRDHVLALGAIGLLAIGALAVGVTAFARGTDGEARKREETVIENGVHARVHELEQQVAAIVVWDDAIRNIDHRFNAQWVHENIGQYFSATGSFAFAIVLNHDNQPLYAMRDGEASELGDVEVQQTAAVALLADVRRRELQEGPNPVLGNPIQASSIQWIDNRLFVVIATLVQPDFGYARLRHATAPIVVVGRELDEGFMAAFGERYLLSDIHVHEGDSRSEPTEAHAALLDQAGLPIATLDWTPQTPGQRLLSQILPALLGLLSILLAVTLWLYARAHRTRSQLAESVRHSDFLARHDTLTGLPNRVAFEDALLRTVVASAQSGETFAVFCIDLDRFKELNDTYGHDVGDEAIRVAASRLRGFAEQVARLDGDGFAVLLTDTSQERAVECARSLIESLAEPLELSIGSRLVGGSVGVALSDHHLHEPLEMLRRADMALFRAKAEGRACYRFFDEQMDIEFKNKRTLKEDLRTAIATGKLHLVYQPQVRLSGEVVGVEALVRWDHDVLGPVSPTLFVPLAEESGLIHALGDYTLRQAALDGLRWPGVKTAVNVSATQLQSPGFAERVKRIVTETGAETSAIEIELTEGVLYANENQMRTALDDLHAAGFSIALDDFGTGYSSLSYLPRFPIDKIKIDRSFVSDLGRDAKADVLFEAIVKLAQTLGMRVIAEGVETQDQWLRLSAAGCPKVQGYVASKPLTADGAATFIASATSEAHAPTICTVRAPVWGVKEWWTLAGSNR